MAHVPDVEQANQRMVPVCTSVLARHGLELQSGVHRVLDFGCGTGRHVREFCDAGYQTVGVEQPAPAEVEARETSPLGGLVFSSSEEGEFPFEDETFDFCFSTSVMEHVMDYDRPLAEIRRVLKTGAFSLHVFPSRWRPIESHIYVPLGGVLQHPWWLRLWAELGVRNEYQRNKDARETAAANFRYTKTGINYPTKGEIVRCFGAHFENVQFVEKDFIAATRNVSRASRLAAPFVNYPVFEALYRGIHTRVVLVRKR